MKPKCFEEMTGILGAPIGWDVATHGPCEGLPFMRGPNGGLYSYWKPSWKEIWDLVRGGRVRLIVMSGLHPPVSIDALKKHEL